MCKRITFLLFLFNNLAILALFSQSIDNTYQDIAESEDYSHRFVFNTYQDSKGLLWIATFAGLDRWDGHRMVNYTYSPFDTLGIPTKRVGGVFGDDQNNLWIGSYDGELIRFNMEKEYFQTIPIKINGVYERFSYFKYDQNGFLWLKSREATEIFKYFPDKDSLRRIPIQGPAGIKYKYSKPIIMNDTTGGIWIFDGREHFGQLDKEKEVFNLTAMVLPEFVIEPLLIMDIEEDSRGNFWLLGQKAELAKFNPYNGEFEWIQLETFSKQYFSDVGFAIDHEDRIWYTSEYELKRYDPVTRTVNIIYNLPFSHSYYRLDSDIQGNILLSSISGVKLIDSHEDSFTTINLKEKLSLNIPPIITCIMQNQHTIWIGTAYSGIIKYNLENDELVEYCADGQSGSIRDNSISKILRDRNGSLWFMTRNDALLYKYDQSLDAFEYLYKAPTGVVTQDETGCFYILGPSQIICFNPMTQDTTHIRFKKSLPYQKLDALRSGNFFISDKKGVFWYARLFECLYRIDPTNRDWNRYDYNISDPTGLPDSEIMDLFCDSRNNIWISTAVGLSKIVVDHNNDTAITFNNQFITDLGLGPTGEINEDRNGNILVNTTNGMLLIKPDGTIDHITSQNGLNFGSPLIWRSESSNKDEVIFITGETINKVPASFFAADTCSVNTNITEFKLLGEVVTPGEISPLESSILFADRIDLKHDQNFFRFGFAATHLSHSEKNRYRYFLEGIDQDTVEAGNQRFAEYTDLKPGKYTFWVTGASHRGPWDPMGSSIEIQIHPPWYRTQLALGIYLTMFISLVIGLIRFRTNRLKKETIRLESEVENRTMEIREKNMKITELDSLKTRFFNNISHEFRTLVTMIKAPAEAIMEEEKISRRGKAGLEVIYRNTNRLMNLVNQLLDISRIDKSRLKLHLQQGNIFDFAHGIAVSFAALAETRGIQYKYYLPRTDSLEWFDADKLEKIMNNLLSNAFKFTEEGGKVRLEMTFPEKDSGMENLLEMSIIDTGPGIPEEEQNKIFDRFYQAEGHLKKEGGGTGIGLSLTQDIVELMHGTIQLESQPGRGSTFTIRIPLGLDHLKAEEYTLFELGQDEAKADIPPISQASEKSSVKETSDEKDQRPLLLVVEDNSDILWLLSTKLGKYFRVKEAVDGSAGWKLATEEMPELIITDLMMPRMDGYELCKKLKTDVRTSHIPVIMLTAKASMDDKMAGLETGADDYITKPFDIKEILARSRNLVEQRKKLREKFSSEITLDPLDIVITSTDEKFLKRVMDAIDRHMSDESFNVARLSEEMHMSASTLFRKLDALTNQAPVDFIRTLRLKRAAVLLKERYGNISEVALEVGFSNPSYFAKMFKQAFSVSPSAFSKLQST